MTNDKVKLTKWNAELGESEPLTEMTGSQIAYHFETPEQFVDFFQEYVNRGMKDYRAGIECGKKAINEHRTIQASMTRFCLGFIVGIAQTDWYDARNEATVAMGKKIAQLIEDGTIKMGWMI